MQKFKFFTLAILAMLSVNFAWGADSGLQPADGKFIIDFYDSSKLTSPSGTGLTNSNYSNFVKVATGLTKSNVVTSVSVTGMVQYGKNGGLTAGTGTAAGASSHYVTFNIGDDYAVNKVTVYATEYESGKWQLNGTNASSGSLGSKGATFSNVTSPLVWDDLDGVTTLTFKKMGTGGGNQKRLTIYTIVCEYTSSPTCTAPTITNDLSETEVVYTKGATANDLSITATGTDVTYQWYSNTTKSTTGATKLTGQTSSSYKPSTATTGTTYYYCAAASSTCTTNSKFAKITVNAPTCYVTFLNNGQPISGAGIDAQGRKQYHEGDQLGTLPTLTSLEACDASSNHFMGWTSDAGFQKRAAPPSSFVSASTTVNGDMTLRAVWAREE